MSGAHDDIQELAEQIAKLVLDKLQGQIETNAASTFAALTLLAEEMREKFALETIQQESARQENLKRLEEAAGMLETVQEKLASIEQRNSVAVTRIEGNVGNILYENAERVGDLYGRRLAAAYSEHTVTAMRAEVQPLVIEAASLAAKEAAKGIGFAHLVAVFGMGLFAGGLLFAAFKMM